MNMSLIFIFWYPRLYPPKKVNTRKKIHVRTCLHVIGSWSPYSCGPPHAGKNTEKKQNVDVFFYAPRSFCNLTGLVGRTMKPSPTATAKRAAVYWSPMKLGLLKNFFGGSTFSCFSLFTSISTRLGVQMTNRRQPVSRGGGGGTPIYERYRHLCLMKQLALEIDPLWHICGNIRAKWIYMLFASGSGTKF